MRSGTLFRALVLLALLVFPFVANDFWVQQIGGRTLGLGTVALSLVFLAAHGGMLSLGQMALAGVAGYAVAYFTAPVAGVGLLLPLPAALAIALGLATFTGLLIGLIAVRTSGIYTLMLTLAIAMGFYYLALQNYALFNGFTGFTQVDAPDIAGVSFAEPRAFYWLCIGAALGCYGLVTYLATTPFGLAMQAARDNPRRLSALGYHVASLRVAAFGVAGLIAGIGGVLGLWLNGSISPGSIALVPTIDVLMAAVLGGLGHPVGAYVGALLFVIVQNFAIDFIDRERFNTLIGLIFLGVVLFSPDGVIGLVRHVRALFAPRSEKSGPAIDAVAGPDPANDKT
ncbi:branched-chain amino acid ABC transporter permease [Ancylobacter sp. A5.8]|uniref:branched-chain amino acid ABC transporter permease n=1 Tax=Ancylobacter gelatini TaxID=2919920 RepID=UPI001F4EF65F|nr:branched-chain amino acid ABC transporter permease [Ancylobacter gelatini]MCJ8144073.1 branched-chain amino acid ABC transporter permease [Ancylobacter gelatini]